MNDDELGGFRTNQITGRAGPPRRPGASGALTCLERHGVARSAWGLDLAIRSRRCRQPLPAARAAAARRAG